MIRKQPSSDGPADRADTAWAYFFAPAAVVSGVAMVAVESDALGVVVSMPLVVPPSVAGASSFLLQPSANTSASANTNTSATVRSFFILLSPPFVEHSLSRNQTPTPDKTR